MLYTSSNIRVHVELCKMVRSENRFHKVSKIKNLDSCEVLLKGRGLVVIISVFSVKMLKRQALTDFML